MIYESKFHDFKENEGEIYFTESDIESCEDLETLKKWKIESKSLIERLDSLDKSLHNPASIKIKRYHTNKLMMLLKQKIKKLNVQVSNQEKNDLHRCILRYCKQNMTESEYLNMIEWAKNEVEYQKIS